MVDDIAAQPSFMPAKEMVKREIGNANMHQFQIGHVGMSNDYSTQSKQIEVDKKRLNINPYNLKPASNMVLKQYASNFEIGNQQEPLQTTSSQTYMQPEQVVTQNETSKQRDKLAKSNFVIGTDASIFQSTNQATENKLKLHYQQGKSGIDRNEVIKVFEQAKTTSVKFNQSPSIDYKTEAMTNFIDLPQSKTVSLKEQLTKTNIPIESSVASGMMQTVSMV